MPLHPNQPDDFEATIRIYTRAEGGRRTPVYNGIMWDFAYAERNPPGTLYMVYPTFVSTDGAAMPPDEPLPIGVDLLARMFIFVDEMRSKVHRDRIAPGVRFFCQEGGMRAAEGVVTRITGLFKPRPIHRVE